MRINELYIRNFRNIQEASFVLHPHFTVVIGDNGMGKSTILHALRVACGAYILGVKDTSKRHIVDSEIRQVDFSSLDGYATPTIVEARQWDWYGQAQTPFRRERPTFVARTTASDEHVGPAKRMGLRLAEQISAEGRTDVQAPVIAFFGVDRLKGAGNVHNDTKITGRKIFLHGYYAWDNMKVSKFLYSSWLDWIDEDTNVEHKDWLVAFKETIVKAIPFLETNNDVIVTRKGLRFNINQHGQVVKNIPLELLSDGMQMMIEMVAELAFRCITLNGHLGKEAVNQARGIVMIDELDIHLHPSWQEDVVALLIGAFPKIQFVATTHSPYIVQSLKSDMLIRLEDRFGNIVGKIKLESVTSSQMNEEQKHKQLVPNPQDMSLEEVSVELIGMESPFSSANVAAEKEYLSYGELLTNAEQATNTEKAVWTKKLVDFENGINDPGLRAMLKMERIAKNLL